MSASVAREFLQQVGTLPEAPGRATTRLGKVRAKTFRSAVELIDASGVIPMIEQWIAEDEPDRSAKGGRPQVVPPRAVLVALMIAVLEPADLTIKNGVYPILAARLHRAEREELGIDTAKVTYFSTWRALRRIADLIDPYPAPRRERPTWAEVKAIKASPDPTFIATRQRRSNLMLSALIEASVKVGEAHLPKRLDLTVDATVYPIYGKKGHVGRKNRTDDTKMSPEINAGWHAKDQDFRRAAYLDGKSRKTEYTFGYDLHIGMIARARNDQSAPGLIMAAVLNTPGVAPGACAVEVHKAARTIAANLRVTDMGVSIVHRGYSDQHAGNFHRPIEALGFTPVFDYKDDDLKPKGTYGGALFAAGSFYCPSTPEDLLMCHYDYKAERIDEQTYEHRRARLDAYRFTPKKRLTPTDTAVPHQCPAAGPNPTATCAHKPRTSPPGGRTLLPIVNAPDATTADRICTNKESVSIPVADLPKHYQRIPYMSTEWRDLYSPGRNQVQSKNRSLKRVDIRLADQDQRHMRGSGAHIIFCGLKIIACNLYALTTYLREDRDSQAPPPRRGQGRPPKATSYAAFLPDEDESTFIIGEPTKPPPKVA